MGFRHAEPSVRQAVNGRDDMRTINTRQDWPQVMAALVRFTGNLELAEIAVAEAFEQARPDDAPQRVIGVARAIALHRLRRDMVYVSELPLLRIAEHDRGDDAQHAARALAYLSCHPTLPEASRIALLMRLVCGATSAEIGVRLLETEAAVTERIALAERRLRAEGIAFEIPTDAQFAERELPVLALLPRPEAADAGKCEPWLTSSKPWLGSAKTEAWSTCVC